MSELLLCLCCAAAPRDKDARSVESNGAQAAPEEDTLSFRLFPQPRKENNDVMTEEEEEHTPELNEKATKMVAKLRELAANLERDCKKYPKTGKGFLTYPESRYFAIQPSAKNGPDDAAGDDPVAECARWKHGKLAYWADKGACKSGAAEKGHIALRKITKVTWDRHSEQEVTIRHKDGDKAYDMILEFDDGFKAEDWARGFWQFRKLLQVKL